MFSTKALLHDHHHFYNPGNTQKGIVEKVYTKFFPIPSLKSILENMNNQGIRIGVISGCHTQYSTDTRFEEYVSQMSKISSDYDFEPNENGWYKVFNKRNSGKDMILIKSQEVRTRFDTGSRLRDVDVNFIGGDSDNISGGKDLFQTLKSSEDKIAIICHPNSNYASLGKELTLELMNTNKYNISGFEAFNASEDFHKNIENMNYFLWHKKRGISVTDSHHLAKPYPSYTLFSKDLFENFSLDYLKNEISSGNFELKCECTQRPVMFINHTLPILMSLALDPRPLKTLSSKVFKFTKN